MSTSTFQNRTLGCCSLKETNLLELSACTDGTPKFKNWLNQFGISYNCTTEISPLIWVAHRQLAYLNHAYRKQRRNILNISFSAHQPCSKELHHNQLAACSYHLLLKVGIALGNSTFPEDAIEGRDMTMRWIPDIDLVSRASRAPPTQKREGL